MYEIESCHFSHAGLLHRSSKMPRGYYTRQETLEVFIMAATNSVLTLMYQRFDTQIFFSRKMSSVDFIFLSFGIMCFIVAL